MQRITLIILLFLVSACEARKLEPPTLNRAASKDLQNFKDEVCPAALNGLRAVTEDRVMNPENFKDTTVIADLREAAAMLEMVMAECVKTTSPTPDTTSGTTPTPDSTLEKPRETSSVRIALAPTTAQ